MQQSSLEFDGIEQKSIVEFSEYAYLNYAMYVILDRALPHIGDGLKPVQRRIIYAMSELGLKSTAKFKKSARTVGDVLGKFHPHGDSACYEAMVLMAQPFSYRYPLIDGQGNWGVADDPKSFAAMRYTESKLSKYASILLEELQEGTVDWTPNFDGSLQEPKLLPARLPNVLLNGSTGIAVGMSTDIPPHNLNELANALIHILDNPKCTTQDLCDYIPGPDLPTKAEIITSKDDLMSMYASGKGSFRMRATYTKEKNTIVINNLPYQASGAKIIEQIAKQIQNKKLNDISDICDESDHKNPTRISLVLRSKNIDDNTLMHHLFATTDLEKSYRVNMNLVGVDGNPKLKPLRDILNEWLVWRKDTLKRKFSHQLEYLNNKSHLLEGMLIAYLNLDKIIKIIRDNDEPKPIIIKKFALSELQAETVLNIKLRALAKLEEIKIKQQQDQCIKEIKKITTLLKSDKRLTSYMKKEITSDAKNYGNERISAIVSRTEAVPLKNIIAVNTDPVSIVLSVKGWVRCAKGHEVNPAKLNYKSGDDFLDIAYGKNNQLVVFLDSSGRSYALLANSLPSARGNGEPLSGKLNPASGIGFSGLCIANNEDYILLSSNAGYGFITTFANMITKNKSGKSLLSIPENRSALAPIVIKKDSYWVVAIVTSGRMLVFPLEQITVLNKGRGNKIIQTDYDKNKPCLLKHIVLLAKNQSLIIHTQKNKTKKITPKGLISYIAEKSSLGFKLPRDLQKIRFIEADNTK